MCGITGFYSRSNKFNQVDLEKINLAIAHRGPDAAGFYFENRVGLGHRRLSILDLSESANQPMHSQCGRYVAVYNGEVYNYQEIAQELKSITGIRLKTTSDTEVLLEAFAYWKTDFVNKLNGMFAIAIYDKQEELLYVFRDRIGIKPIYYFWDGTDLVFASELKSIKQLKGKIQFQINKTAINEYLHLGYIPEPHSIFSKVFKFPTGHFLEIGKNEFRFECYWNPEEKIAGPQITDFSSAKSTLKNLVKSSVKYRMISDVPFGTFLSGGIDSSLVTAVAQEQSATPVNTFSIGFNEAKNNESSYAKKVASYIGTKHHEFTVTEKDAIELADKLPRIYDEPYADSSAIPTLLVSQLARKNVTMTLSGDGGDELFLGYGAYNWAKRLSHPAIKLFRKPIAYSLSQLPDKYKRAAHLFTYEANSKKSHIFSQEQFLFSRNEIKNLVTTNAYSDIKLNENYPDFEGKLTPAEQQAFFDLKYYLKDDLLVKVDRATMQHSLETRVPLLDYRIIEFALNLSPELKMKGGVQKYLLKEVLFDYVPKEYFERPKWGFAVPLEKWLKEELRYMIDIYLSENTVKKFGFIKYEVVEKLIFMFLNKKQNFLYNRIWILINLHVWLEENQ